ncbi:Fimbria A protein precursor [Serratia quinivorans]|uniref:fimbrial protein n=1 Tax=Serratia TaxID=613 RepID=UPI0021797AE1|nr:MULTISPECIES: fimbrial protein [Serratia]CAI1123404.1 Fimbria A protein precursor [Serratia entomophila]CAI0837786.1 Fimbria A protein precursor [Serratia quinivorans]CAI1032964.1 Fimbria A protein precursor [Serratia quinivorans]CAI1034277.1 Fimbria A protein precursor [Serratia quinivorans]CAI1048192.1 Fimbria A protein precursor [Serratia quinivorans]
MKGKSGKRPRSGVPHSAAASLLLAQALIAVPLPTLAAAENNVYLHGALVAEPCVIPPGEENIALDFGTVIDKYLYLNSRTPGQSFSLHLTECDVSLGKTVKVTFLGTENAALPGLLALDGGSQATGIAIGLETEQAKPVPINTASDPYQLQDGDNRIALKAYVQGEPEALKNQSIERGPFSAVATFSLEYE